MHGYHSGTFRKIKNEHVDSNALGDELYRESLRRKQASGERTDLANTRTDLAVSRTTLAFVIENYNSYRASQKRSPPRVCYGLGVLLHSKFEFNYDDRGDI